MKPYVSKSNYHTLFNSNSYMEMDMEMEMERPVLIVVIEFSV